MLHPILSNGICSLNPDEDKLTKTVIMDIDNNSVNKDNSNLLFDEMSRGNKRTKRQNRCSYILTGLGMLLTAAAAFITLIID